MTSEEYICADCLTVAAPKQKKPGSKQVEIILWSIIPVICLPYTLWRMFGKKPVCRRCDSYNILSAKTPEGQKLLEKYLNDDLAQINQNSGLNAVKPASILPQNDNENIKTASAPKLKTNYTADDFLNVTIPENIKNNVTPEQDKKQPEPKFPNIASTRRDPSVKINTDANDW